MRRMKSMTSWLVLSVIALGFASSAAATEINLGKHIESVKVSGDLRLRQENFTNETSSTTASLNRGRSRMRYRLRVGLEIPLHQKLTAKLRFASGAGEQTSTNQSFDNLSAQNPLWIDLAMLEYKPFGFLKLTGGRMELPLWRTYTSDIVWDGDFSPQGFGLSAEQLVGPTSVFANTMYMVVDEDSSNAQGTDQSELSAQIGAEVKLPLEARLRAAFAQHQWINERAGSFGSAPSNTTQVAPTPQVQNGNRRSGGALLNEFRVNELTAQLSFWVASVPVAVQGTFINNIGALDTLSTPSKKDKGSQAGVIVGKAKNAKSFEAAYFRKVSEFDATVADVADSDFGNGGTGRKGTIMWVSYAPTDYTNISVKYFDTALEDGAIFPFTAGVNRHDIKRLQADFSVKF